jgi:hypothetical protein
MAGLPGCDAGVARSVELRAGWDGAEGDGGVAGGSVGRKEALLFLKKKKQKNFIHW